VIADLHARELSPNRWGWKAARLAQAATLGIPVPEGLCLDSQQTSAPPHIQRTILSAWLTACRPPVVVVRSSSTSEDTPQLSAAGRFMTLRDVRSTPDEVMEAVARVQHSLSEHGSTGCVIVQHQLRAQLMGVTFTQPDGEFLTEGSPQAGAVTDGQPPAFSMTCRQDTFTVEGVLDIVPPVRLARDLRFMIGQLQTLFDFPLDIEWATVAGHPFLLQVRPVTTPIRDVA
jgi:phosphoenolpyruvate synthase/pyruvate phosphate dikinase